MSGADSGPMDAMLFIMFDFGINYLLVFHGGLQVKIKEVQPSTFLAKLKKAEGLKDWVVQKPPQANQRPKPQWVTYLLTSFEA